MKTTPQLARRIALAVPVLLVLAACGPSEQPADNFEAETAAPAEEPVIPMENFEAAQEEGAMDDGAMMTDSIDETTGDPAVE